MGKPTHPAPKTTKSLGQEISALFGEFLRGAQFLLNYAPVPTFASKPARDLTDQEAFDLLMHLVFHGRITLDQHVKVDDNGKIIDPKPGRQILVKTSIAGVDFLHASGAFSATNGSLHTVKDKRFAPTPTFAIVLHRLAEFLAKEWGATAIVWGGVGKGADNKSKNCHEVGTCMDFYGATTKQGAFDVTADWTRSPVYKADGTELKVTWNQNLWGVASFENRWGPATQTYYRLRSGLDTPAYDFFADVYGFVNEQCTSSGDSNPHAFSSNQPLSAGQTIHPDYPNPTLRKNHRDHMHFQLGKAFL
jgi:hypothetical protein